MDIDLTADLNAGDDAGLGWSTLRRARFRLRPPGAMLHAGNRSGQAADLVVAVVDEGQVPVGFS